MPNPFAVAAAVAAVAASAIDAAAADLPNAPAAQSSPVLGQQPAAPSWLGFYMGTGVSVVGGKGMKGGVGGEVFAGYDHKLDNNLVVGLKAQAGYAPAFGADPRFAGLSYAGGEAKLGYRIGQVTPYVLTGVDFVRANRFATGGFDPAQAVTDAFAGPGAARAVGMVGLGATYQVNSKFSVGVEARFVNGAAAAP